MQPVWKWIGTDVSVTMGQVISLVAIGNLFSFSVHLSNESQYREIPAILENLDIEQFC